MGVVVDQGLFAPMVWVVVTSKPSREVVAKRELGQQGFEVYLPMKLFENRRGELQATPFFPRYLFARVPAQVEQWRSIFSTYGVSGVLGCSATRAVGVRDELVERIRAQEEAGYIKIGLRQGDSPRFEKGQRLRVGGVGIDAVFDEPVDARRASILVSLLGRDSRVVVDLHKLKAAPA